MRMLIVALALSGLSFPPPADDQATRLGEASDRITQSLNLYAKAAEPLRSRMTSQQQTATALFFAAAMALEDNSLSLSGVCQLQQLSKSPGVSKQNILMPLLQQYRTSGAQQTANLSLALPSLPTALGQQANLVLMAVTNAAAVIDKGC